MLAKSGLEVRLLLGKSLQNLCGMIDRPQFRQPATPALFLAAARIASIAASGYCAFLPFLALMFGGRGLVRGVVSNDDGPTLGGVGMASS